MPQPVIRLFVSSTFADFVDCRNQMAVDVYPQLAELCQEFGATFQAVDLRWGISAEAALEHRTVELCLQEIERCQKSSPQPNFIVLLGERYGWRPVPSTIPADVFERLFISDAESERLNRWYSRDDNAIPSEYRLKSVPDHSEWLKEESELRSAILDALNKVQWAPEDQRRRPLEISVTHQEILEGALEPPNWVPSPDKHVFCYSRTIEGLPPQANKDQHAFQFSDYGQDGYRDLESQRRLRDLRDQLRHNLGSSQIRSFKSHFDGRKIVEDTKSLCERIKNDLSQLILAQLRTLKVESATDSQNAFHERFAEDALAGFTGQETLLGAIHSYVRQTDPAPCRPLVVEGPAGAGKSTLLAKAASQIQDEHTLVVKRFLGTTALSTGLGSLLSDLCRELSRHHPDADSNTKSVTPLELSEQFRELIMEFPPDQQVVIFLDAIDQLSPDDEAWKLRWLAFDLPSHVRVVLSVATDDPQLADVVEATRRLSAWKTIEAEGLIGGDPLSLMHHWLAESSPPRTVTADQSNLILSHFRRHPRPLYLVLRAYSWLTSDRAQQTGSVPPAPPSRRPGSVKADVTARRTGLDTSAFRKWFGTHGLQHFLRRSRSSLARPLPRVATGSGGGNARLCW